MKTLITSMLSNIPGERPTCAQILADQSWSIKEREIIYFGLDKKNIMNHHQNNFFTNYFRIKINYSNGLGKYFKVIENIGEGGIGSVFKVQNKSDKKIYTIKKIPNGMNDLNTISWF